MNRLVLLSIVVTALLLVVGGIVTAQSGNGFDLSWSTVDGGGGVSTGGGFTVAGTSGQPEGHGGQTGGRFGLVGGFWGVTLPPGETVGAQPINDSLSLENDRPVTGYDPDDPLTARGVGHEPGSYVDFLDGDALKGARVGVLREPMGRRSEPGTIDFNKVTQVFDKAVSDIGGAGAEIVDPVVIPDLAKLLAKRSEDAEVNEQAFTGYLAGSANPPYGSLSDLMASPLLEQVTKHTRDRLHRSKSPEAHYDSLKARELLMTRLLQVMADHRLDAIVHKAVEHQPTLISDGINPPYVDGKGAPHINTFLVFVPSIVVPAGFTADNLPAGITFLGRPYDDANMIRFAYAYEQETHHRRTPPSTP